MENTAQSSATTVIAWLPEPTMLLHELRHTLKEMDSSVYGPSITAEIDGETGGYLLRQQSNERPPGGGCPHVALAMMRASRTVEFECIIKVNKDVDTIIIPTIADVIVGVSEPIELEVDGSSLGLHIPGQRYRIPLGGFSRLTACNIPCDNGPLKLRVRLEPDENRPHMLKEPVYTRATTERRFSANTVRAGGVAIELVEGPGGWPAPTNTACEEDALWLPEPRLRKSKIIAVVRAMNIKGFVSVERADGGVWVRGLHLTNDFPLEMTNASRVYELTKKIKIDARGIGWLQFAGTSTFFVVAVSEEVTFFGAIGLGRYLPGRRYRIPFKKYVVVKGAPGTKVKLRLQATNGKEIAECTFADADKNLYDYRHGHHCLSPA
jgi:hypothetical protein